MTPLHLLSFFISGKGVKSGIKCMTIVGELIECSHSQRIILFIYQQELLCDSIQ